ncbi:SGNH/GDSL hydrolase family protein [Planctomonas deserti]|uniref:SGNH/GDSL hydrolase family protein n=1 Tax=Planctomonas deserti TaxID=2144185 RepID=UPI00131EF256|nr:SGNH/GDSL hydrolase family protein [Planctomonas deserti]
MSVVLQIIGDSTGLVPSATTGWPRQLAQWLATSFPAYTAQVKDWDASSAHAYGSWTTIQTGTGTGNAGGPFTLSIYNGSASGQNLSYPIATISRFTTMIPATPDLVIFNMGHNNTGASGLFYRGIYFPMVRAVRDAFPRAGMISIIQNPRKAVDSDYAIAILRQQTIEELAGNLGMGTINILDRFLAVPSRDTTLMNDNVHPNQAGIDLWASVVIGHMVSSLATTPASPTNEFGQLWVPAPAFQPDTATAGSANGLPSLILPNDTDVTLSASFVVPPYWNSHAIYAVFTTPNEITPSGQFMGIRSRTRSIGGLGKSMVHWGNSLTGAGAWANNQASPSLIGFPTSAGQGTWPTTTYLMVTVAATSVLNGIQILRIGTDSGDTFTGVAHFLGCVVAQQS